MMVKAERPLSLNVRARMDELTRYIFTYYAHLMTLHERAAYKSIIAEEKAENVESSRLAQFLRERWVSSDPEVKALLADGQDKFMKSVCDRILREHADKVYFNYCPNCKILARTPRAKQCPKCFYDWHDAT